MVNKFILFISTAALFGLSIFLFVFSETTYQNATSKFTIEQMADISDAHITTIQNLDKTLNREELVNIMKSQNKLNIANREFLDTQNSFNKSFAKFLFCLLVLHVVIVFCSTKGKSKPNKAIKSDL
jgi:Ca2+-binding EF-hand superfamily protein